MCVEGGGGGGGGGRGGGGGGWGGGGGSSMALQLVYWNFVSMPTIYFLCTISNCVQSIHALWYRFPKYPSGRMQHDIQAKPLKQRGK